MIVRVQDDVDDVGVTTRVFIEFSPAEASHVEHFKVLMEAMAILADRGVERAEVWRRSGVKGQAFHLMSKAERAFSAVMRGERPNRDNWIDAINYAAFGARADHDLDGSWPWQER